jgi:hypothetical protein
MYKIIQFLLIYTFLNDICTVKCYYNDEISR